MTPNSETMIFTRKTDAKRVTRRLRDHSILALQAGREFTAVIPPDRTGESLRGLMRLLLDETA